MANTINIPKAHVLLALSLPLAVVIGYFLAEPMELSSIAMVVLVLGVLCIPLMLRWYHPLLVASWNAAISPMFLPGRPSLWSLLAFTGLLFGLLSRAVNPKAQFLNVPAITRPLLALTAVVIVTAMLTGGAGLHVFGSETFGGKKYFYIMAAVAGYFALTSRRIPEHRAGLYVALFFLSGLTSAAADLAYAAGPQFRFLLALFSPDYASDQANLDQSLTIHDTGMVRMGGLGWLGTAGYAFLLARYGIRGSLDLHRPWRLLLLLLAFVAGLGGGFRSFVVLFGLTCVVLFFLEGLHRTRYLPALLGVCLLGGAILLPHGDKLPLVAQRSLCFLPGRFDSLAVESARVSTGWRVEMWKQVLPEVPTYLFRGKGYALDANDLYMAIESGNRFGGESLSGTILAGDYHSGPLSIVIPFGIYGVIAFMWLLVAGLRVLYRNFKWGSPALRRINALLFASFAARAFFFFVGFGSLHSDLANFLGLLGLAVALNSAEATVAEEANQPAPESSLRTQYIRV